MSQRVAKPKLQRGQPPLFLLSVVVVTITDGSKPTSLLTPSTPTSPLSPPLYLKGCMRPTLFWPSDGCKVNFHENNGHVADVLRHSLPSPPNSPFMLPFTIPPMPENLSLGIVFLLLLGSVQAVSENNLFALLLLPLTLRRKDFSSSFVDIHPCSQTNGQACGGRKLLPNSLPHLFPSPQPVSKCFFCGCQR